VQHVHAVGLELLRGDVQRVLTLLDEAALDGVLDVGELDARVADRRTTEPVQDMSLRTGLRADLDLVARQQAVVAVQVGDDLDLGVELGVTLDQATDRGRQAGREAAGGQQSHTTNSHLQEHLSSGKVHGRRCRRSPARHPSSSSY
jgi:hypothetical protein